jgi:hypothetical protein
VAKIAPSDHALAQAILSPRPPPDYFETYLETCRAHIHKLAEETFAPEQLDAREAWVARGLAYVEHVYRLAAEFAPDVDQICNICNYLSTRSLYPAPTTIH